MDFYKEKLLTVITESEIEEHLIEDVNRLGAKGYTISSVGGKGEKGLRNAIWSANSNIKPWNRFARFLVQHMANYNSRLLHDHHNLVTVEFELTSSNIRKAGSEKIKFDIQGK